MKYMNAIGASAMSIGIMTKTLGLKCIRPVEHLFAKIIHHDAAARDNGGDRGLVESGMDRYPVRRHVQGKQASYPESFDKQNERRQNLRDAADPGREPFKDFRARPCIQQKHVASFPGRELEDEFQHDPGETESVRRVAKAQQSFAFSNRNIYLLESVYGNQICFYAFFLRIFLDPAACRKGIARAAEIIYRQIVIHQKNMPGQASPGALGYPIRSKTIMEYLAPMALRTC